MGLVAVEVSRAIRVIPLVAAVLLGGCSHSGRSSSDFPVDYRVVYSDVINGVHQWEVLTIHRPFDGSDLYYATNAMPSAPKATPSGGLPSAKDCVP